MSPTVCTVCMCTVYVCTGADPGILERGEPVRGRSPESSAEGASAGGGLGASPPPNFFLKN